MSEPSETIRILIASDFSDALLEELREISPRLHIERHYPNVPDRAWGDVEVLYTSRQFPNPNHAPRLRWIQLASAGVDHAVNEPIMKAEDVEVTTASGIHATQISEYCLAMMLAFTYKIPRMLANQAKATWSRDGFLPTPLRGQTVGIVGHGQIGRELARAADALGMRVLAIKRDVMHPADTDSYTEPGTGDPAGEIPARIYPPEAIASMARECDFLVVATPLVEGTRKLINADVLRAMKKTAVLINIARGSVVDEPELISALAAGRIGGAALDVFAEEPLPNTSPLWGMDNVIISPHIAGAVVDYNQRAARLFAENLRRYLEHRPLLNVLRRDRGY